MAVNKPPGDPNSGHSYTTPIGPLSWRVKATRFIAAILAVAVIATFLIFAVDILSPIMFFIGGALGGLSIAFDIIPKFFSWIFVTPPPLACAFRRFRPLEPRRSRPSFREDSGHPRSVSDAGDYCFSQWPISVNLCCPFFFRKDSPLRAIL